MILGFVQFKNYDRLKVIKLKQNVGVSVARNIGMQHARGQYIAFQDSDDFSTADRIEKQVAFLQNNPEIEILGGRSVQWYEGE